MSQRTPRARASSAGNDSNGEDGGAPIATAEAPAEKTSAKDFKDGEMLNLGALKEM